MSVAIPDFLRTWRRFLPTTRNLAIGAGCWGTGNIAAQWIDHYRSAASDLPFYLHVAPTLQHALFGSVLMFGNHNWYNIMKGGAVFMRNPHSRRNMLCFQVASTFLIFIPSIIAAHTSIFAKLHGHDIQEEFAVTFLPKYTSSVLRIPFEIAVFTVKNPVWKLPCAALGGLALSIATSWFAMHEKQINSLQKVAKMKGHSGLDVYEGEAFHLLINKDPFARMAYDLMTEDTDGKLDPIEMEQFCRLCNIPWDEEVFKNYENITFPQFRDYWNSQSIVLTIGHGEEFDT